MLQCFNITTAILVLGLFPCFQILYHSNLRLNQIETTSHLTPVSWHLPWFQIRYQANLRLNQIETTSHLTPVSWHLSLSKLRIIVPYTWLIWLSEIWINKKKHGNLKLFYSFQSFYKYVTIKTCNICNNERISKNTINSSRAIF